MGPTALPALIDALKDKDPNVRWAVANALALKGPTAQDLLADLMPDGLMVVSDGIIVFANPSLQKIFGAKSPDELLGKLATDLVGPEERKDIPGASSSVCSV